MLKSRVDDLSFFHVFIGKYLASHVSEEILLTADEYIYIYIGKDDDECV